MCSIQALALALATITAAPNDLGDDPRVTGSVTLVGEPPERRAYELDEFMRPFHDADVFLDEEWLVGEKGELANVVVSLHALDLEEPPRPKPVKDAVYGKVGPRYVPRVLVVPVGSEVTLRNVDSPCNGFMGRGRHDQFNMTLVKGTEKKVELQHRGVIPVQCDLRELMRGAIVVVDTPWYAKSGADGRFELPSAPPGRYRLRVWHEVLGRVRAGVPETVTIEAGAQPPALELRVPAPRAPAELERDRR